MYQVRTTDIKKCIFRWHKMISNKLKSANHTRIWHEKVQMKILKC
jgi:hypothetical protein